MAEHDFHILAVDDEPGALWALELLLESRGWRISTAADGIEALERFRACPADALVTDLRMPRMDGVELVRHLRALVPALPIIVMTGFVPFGESGPDFGTPPLAILRKPVDAAELLATLEAVAGVGGRNNKL